MRQRIRNAWQKLLHEEATPNKVALGFAVGLFMAFFPMPIIDTLIAVLIAYLLKANRAACLIGNNFVLLLFPIIPFVFGTEYVIGRHLMHLSETNNTVPIGWTLWSWLQSPRETFKALLIGAVILAIPAAMISFGLVKSATSRWQRNHSRVPKE
jgi:uncharacterized protein (DUF2062 family)